MLSLLGLQPFHNAVDVETMGTSSPDKWTIVSGTFAIRTTPVEGNPEKKQFFERFYDFFEFFMSTCKFHKYHRWRSISKKQHRSSLWLWLLIWFWTQIVKSDFEDYLLELGFLVRSDESFRGFLGHWRLLELLMVGFRRQTFWRSHILDFPKFVLILEKLYLV